MNKQEYFVIMGSIIGVLFLIVVALSIVLKMGFDDYDTKEIVTDNNSVVVENKTKKESSNTKKVTYKKISFDKEEKSITSDFTINIDDDYGTLTNELFYQTKFYNYYAKDFSSVFTYVNIDNNSYLLKKALSDKIVSIYDIKNKMKDSVREELRYNIEFGSKFSDSFEFRGNILTYKNGKEVIVTKDNATRYTLLDFVTNDFTTDELLDLFKMYNSEDLNTAYVFEDDDKSYMFEQDDTRIFICSNNNIYVTTLSENYNCN